MGEGILGGEWFLRRLAFYVFCMSGCFWGLFLGGLYLEEFSSGWLLNINELMNSLLIIFFCGKNKFIKFLGVVNYGFFEDLRECRWKG